MNRCLLICATALVSGAAIAGTFVPPASGSSGSATITGGTITGTNLNPVYATIAAAGTGQSTAAALTGTENTVTVSGSGQGVQLPASGTQKITVISGSATYAHTVYPASGQAISVAGVGQGTNLGLLIPAGWTAVFSPVSGGWNATLMQSPANVQITGGNIAGANISAAALTATGGTQATTPAARAGQLLWASDFPTNHDRLTDDTNNLQAAINAVYNAGGGVLKIPPQGYAVGATASLEVKTGVVLDCAQPVLYTENYSPYTPLTQPYTFFVGAHPVVFDNFSGETGCNFLSSTLQGLSFSSSNTMRQEINIQQAFANTGIDVSGLSVQLENTFIGGFSLGINQTNGGATFTNVVVDASECLNSTNSYTLTSLKTFRCQVPLTQNSAQQINTWTITGVADNGAGIYRASFSNTNSSNSTPTALSALEAGDTVYIESVGGAYSLNNKWTISAVGANYVDLSGAENTFSTPLSLTGSTTTNSYIVYGLSSNSDIGVGDTITGSGIPASTTVSALWPDYNAIVLSNKATATATGVTLTIADAAYSSGGTMTVDVGMRSGDGFYFGTSTGTLCEQCFEIGHPVGVEAGTGMTWLKITNIGIDRDIQAEYPGTVGLLVDGNANGVALNGGWVLGPCTAVVEDSSLENDPSTVENMTFDAGSPAGCHQISVDNGRLMISGDSGAQAPFPYSLIADNTTSYLTIGDTDIQAGFDFQDATAAGRLTRGVGVTLASSQYSGGSMALPGSVSIGAAGSVCQLGATCGVTMSGPQIDATAQSITMTSAGSGSIQSNVASVSLGGSGTISSYTLSLPSDGVGSKLDIYFANAVTALTLSGQSEVGFPASPAANSWHKCQVFATGTWSCN